LTSVSEEQKHASVTEAPNPRGDAKFFKEKFGPEQAIKSDEKKDFIAKRRAM
jgi:hypothetical protein